ncbi:MAG TPA: universal stress protein [Candidatus Binataceae bacterium]|nr:universal stress protein [Candidatus Binataceae bacterium]
MELFNKILCPIDFDDHSRAALETARGLAQGPDATIYLLHVVRVAPVIGGVPIEPYAVTGSDVKAEIEQMLPPQAERAVIFQVLARKGNAAAEILRAIGELGVDSVVMATHGRKGIGRLVLGSVTAHVVREAPCPVLTITAAAIGRKENPGSDRES